jgi:hypothetical protein
MLVSLTACSAAAAQPAQIDPPFPAPGSIVASPHAYPIESGWYDGAAVTYYNFGTNTFLNPDDPSRVHIEPVWHFITGLDAEGKPTDLAGQHNLFSATVGDPNYSDLWQPYFVTAPADYVADTITSADQLLASGFQIEKQPVFVNCPIVPEGSTLTDSDLPLKVAWVNGQQVSYFDFGPTGARPGNVYVFITGFDSTGQPQVMPGQHFVFDRDKSDSGYSDFWIVQWVKVDAAYQPDSVRAVADIQAEITASTLVVNYPQR